MIVSVLLLQNQMSVQLLQRLATLMHVIHMNGFLKLVLAVLVVAMVSLLKQRILFRSLNCNAPSYMNTT